MTEVTWERVNEIVPGQQFVMVFPVFSSVLTGVSAISVLPSGETTLEYIDGTTESAVVAQTELLLEAALIEAVQKQRIPRA